jgi:hypothetical protein
MPGDVAWHWAELERDDVANAEGANYEEWRDLSGGTRRVGDAVSVVVSAARHATGYAADIAISAASIAERYDRGERLEPPILVAPTSLIRLVVVEGHTRLVGWMISKQPGPLAVIVGLSDQIPGWGWY